MNSSRISPKGFYTNRKDIPKWERRGGARRRI